MNIGLVLSGGMAKGAFQIGVLKALAHFIPIEEIKYMSCSSIGVLNGYAYAIGELDKAEEIWKSICNNDARLFVSQILRSSILQNSIGSIYDKEKKLDRVFYCALFDMNCRNIVYKDLSSVDSDKLIKYLKASVAMPVYNRAVKIDEGAFFDGAMVDNIPVYPLLKRKLDYLVCVYFDDVCYKFENSCFDNKIIKITFPSNSILKQSLVLTHEEIDEMIGLGYERAMQLLTPVFSNGYDDIEHIYNSIKSTDSKSKSLRITGDVFVTNLNKITQHLTKRKIL